MGRNDIEILQVIIIHWNIFNTFRSSSWILRFYRMMNVGFMVHWRTEPIRFQLVTMHFLDVRFDSQLKQKHESQINETNDTRDNSTNQVFLLIVRSDQHLRVFHCFSERFFLDERHRSSSYMNKSQSRFCFFLFWTRLPIGKSLMMWTVTLATSPKVFLNIFSISSADKWNGIPSISMVFCWWNSDRIISLSINIRAWTVICIVNTQWKHCQTKYRQLTYLSLGFSCISIFRHKVFVSERIMLLTDVSSLNSTFAVCFSVFTGVTVSMFPLLLNARNTVSVKKIN